MEDIDERLIGLVQGHKCLYDQSSSDYKDQMKKDNAWRSIGVELDREGSWPYKRFTYLRDRYTRKKMELKTKSGQEATRITKWRYFKLMGFLDPFSKYQTTESNFQDNDGSIQDCLDEEDHESPPPSDLPGSDIPARHPSSGGQTPGPEIAASSLDRQSPLGLPETHVIKKKRQSTTPQTNDRSEMIAALKRSTDAIVNRKPRDECMVWAESVGMRLLTMSPHQRALVRLRVEQVLFDVEYGSCSTHQQQSMETPSFSQPYDQQSSHVTLLCVFPLVQRCCTILKHSMQLETNTQLKF